MKTSNSIRLLPIAFSIWIFFVLGSFFAVQKPFSAADLLAISQKLSGLSILDGLVLIILGAGLWYLRRRLTDLLPAKVLWLLFILGAFLIVQKPFSIAQALAIGNVLLDLLTASWLVLAALGVGGWLIQRVLSINFSFAETIVFGISLGLGSLGLIGLAFGLLGLFQPLVAYGVVIVLSLILVPQFKETFRRWQGWQSPHSPGLLPTLYLLLILLLALLLALLPPTDWDGLFYHLTGPKLHIQAGGVAGAIDIPHLNFPSLMEMLFTWALLLRGDIAAKLLHTAFGLLLAGLVYLTARHFLSQKSAWFAVLVFASMPMISTLAGWAYNDLALAFYQLASLYAIIRWRLEVGNWRLVISNWGLGIDEFKIENRKSEIQNLKSKIESRYWLILSGIFAGLAMGLKYTSFVTPVTIGLLILWHSIHIPRTTHYALRTISHVPRLTNLALFSLSALLTALPWYAKNWIFTGNPVYPFLYGLFGGQYWDAFRADWYTAAGTGVGFQPSTLLALPWLLTLGVRDVNYWDGRTGPLLLLFLPLMLFYALFHYRRRTLHVVPKNSEPDGVQIRPVALNLLLMYALAHFVVWTLGVIWSRSLWQARLLLPGLVALAPVAGWLWAELPRFDAPNFSLSRFVNLAIGLTLALTLLDMGLLTFKIDPLPYLVGAETRDQYLTRRLGAHYETMQQINQTLPAEAKVVFLWEPRSYYCRQDCRPDSILDEFPHLVYRYGSAEAIAQAWRDSGVSHVLVHRSGLDFVLNESPEVVDQAVLATLENQHMRELFDTAGAYQVYALKPAP